MREKELMVNLSIYEKGEKQQKICICGTNVKKTVGRLSENDICIGNSEVSRKHCELIIRKGRLVVKDLESLHGTFINQKCIGRRKEPSDKYVYLNDGDCLGVSQKIQIHVHCVDMSCKKSRQCMMCGGLFETSGEGEFCPDCQWKMASQLDMFPDRELEYADKEFFQEEIEVAEKICLPKENSPVTLVEYYREYCEGKSDRYLYARKIWMQLLLDLAKLHYGNKTRQHLVPEYISVISKGEGAFHLIYSDQKIPESKQYDYKPRQQRIAEKEKTVVPFNEKVAWDVWATAAVVYHLLTGHAPKDGAGNMVPIWVYDLAVPVELAYVLDRALNDEGELYYDSSAQLFYDLSKMQNE